MDRFSKYLAIAGALRNAVCELELVTALHLADGTVQESTHARRAVCRKITRRAGKTILEFADVDRAALERVFPFEVYGVGDFPEIFIDHVGRRIPQGVGTATKVPMTWITKTGGTWSYAGPKRLTGAEAVLAVYRGTTPGQGALVDPSEYSVGTAIGAASGVQVLTINFTKEQADQNGRPYVIEADLDLGGNRSPSAEAQRLLGLYGVTADAATFAAAAAADAPKGTRLILLGTGGGPTPKKNRSAPAQVIVINGVSYVVDCGNGVGRQYVSAGLKLKAIRNVFITHQHSDHNADYGTLLLLAWATDLTGPVDAWGPPPLAAMTTKFLELYDYDIRTRIADEGRPPLAPMIHPHELTEGGLVMQDANVKVTSALVKHPPVSPAFAFRFDSADRSIVISGDTAPSENLVRLAYGADVLVHEVMHLPSLDKLLSTEPNAKTLREHLLASHTSTEDVGRIATEAKVKTLVLSHFVPGGYPFLEDSVWLDAVRPYFKGEIIVGRDLLEV